MLTPRMSARPSSFMPKRSLKGPCSAWGSVSLYRLINLSKCDLRQQHTPLLAHFQNTRPIIWPLSASSPSRIALPVQGALNTSMGELHLCKIWPIHKLLKDCYNLQPSLCSVTSHLFINASCD